MKNSANVQHLSLHQYNSCPFCLITQMNIAKTNLDIERRNIQQHAHHRQELLAGGGRQQVPCLRIDYDNGSVDWLYESSDIIRWVNAYSKTQNKAA